MCCSAGEKNSAGHSCCHQINKRTKYFPLNRVRCKLFGLGKLQIFPHKGESWMITLRPISHSIALTGSANPRISLSWRGRSFIPLNMTSGHLRLRFNNHFFSTIRDVKPSYRILSIDGGGIRGIIPGTVMEYMERYTGKPLHHLFDGIAGTSTGGILALSASVPYRSKHQPSRFSIYDPLPLSTNRQNRFSAREILSIYTDPKISQRIFSRVSDESKEDTHLKRHKVTLISLSGEVDDWQIKNVELELPISEELQAWFATKYQVGGLTGILQQRFGTLKLEDLLTDVLITSVDVSTRTPQLFTRAKAVADPEENHLVWKVARMTSAAPTFFDPLILKGRYFVDGGIVANNPVMCMILDRFKHGIPFENMVCVSLGTGEYRPWLDTTGYGKIQFGIKLFNVMTAVSSESNHTQAKELLGERYSRFQIPLKQEIGLDDTSDQAREMLLDRGQELVKTRKEEIEVICDKLVKIGALNQDREQAIGGHHD